MKSTKSPKSSFKRVKKIVRRTDHNRPDLAAQYREIQWLRDLVKHFERTERKSDR
jgi:hypothetical protein